MVLATPHTELSHSELVHEGLGVGDWVLDDGCGVLGVEEGEM